MRLCYDAEMRPARKDLETDGGEHILFSDGSALGNPGPGGWGAIAVIDRRFVSELGGGKKHTTNNEMELSALLLGMKRLTNEAGDLAVYSDSQYVIKGATEWRSGWESRGWRTMDKRPVLHRGLWEELYEVIDARKKFGHISWKYVPGHVGVFGNERVDEIATAFARGEHPELFEGALADYAAEILHINIDQRLLKKRGAQRSRSRANAYSYVSEIDGKIARHKTWEECESRVKGKAGARYKKALSPEEERDIMRSWRAG